MEATTVCNSCWLEKPLTSKFFPVDKGCITGFRSKCKVCRQADNKRCVSKYPERRKEQSKASCDKHREKINTHQMQYRKDNLELVKSRERSFYTNHTQRVKDGVKKARDSAKDELRDVHVCHQLASQFATTHKKIMGLDNINIIIEAKRQQLRLLETCKTNQ